jgi:hypothetical protein
MYERQQSGIDAPVLDLGQRLFTPPRRDAEHNHGARGTWVDGVTCGAERTHYHRSATGMTAPAPNRPGHIHRLPDGNYTQPALERWSSAGITRL